MTVCGRRGPRQRALRGGTAPDTHRGGDARHASEKVRLDSLEEGQRRRVLLRHFVAVGFRCRVSQPKKTCRIAVMPPSAKLARKSAAMRRCPSGTHKATRVAGEVGKRTAGVGPRPSEQIFPISLRCCPTFCHSCEFRSILNRFEGMEINQEKSTISLMFRMGAWFRLGPCGRASDRGNWSFRHYTIDL